jgi:TolB-like protein/DNA-binding winged helix-turn-helix (wHTH) protein/Flp pilus assembly protein TadD
MGDEKLHLFGDYVLDTARCRLLRGGLEVHLRDKSYEVLKYLAENRGRVVSKQEFNEKVWGGGAVTDDSLVQCVRDVREALGEDGDLCVRTVRKKGYIFEPPDGTWSEQLDVVRVTVEEEEVVDVRGGGDSVFDSPQPALTPPHELARASDGGGTGRADLVAPRAGDRARRHQRAAVIVLAALALAAAGAFYFSARPPAIRSVAVLPFVNEGGNEDVEYLSDGVAESLINSLSQLPDLKVIARSSSFRYRGRGADAHEAARALGVEAVLTGRVFQRGEDILISVEVVDARDNTQVWGERYQRRLADLVTLQQEIARDVSQRLRVRLSGSDEQRLAKSYTKDAEAYQLYLKGRHHVLKLTPAENQKGVSYYQQAIAADPSYALAYFGLAQAYSSLAISGELPPAEWFLKAKAATHKALELDDQLAEAHASHGYLLFWHEWNWGEAEKQFRRALELNPNSAETHMGYALLLSNTGRHAEALAEIKRAGEHDPLNLLIGGNEGQLLVHAGRADEALASLRKSVELDPNFWFTRMIASSAYAEKGMYAEAAAEGRKARELFGGSSHPSAFLGYALARAGRRDEARVELEWMLGRSKERFLSPYNVALVYHGLGETDEALAWLGRGVEQRDPRMTFLGAEPKWNNLRSDPRFQGLLRRVGFTP